MSDKPKKTKKRTEIKLSEFSTETLECFQQFGINAAARLKYSMKLEDALIEQVEQKKQALQELNALKLENADLRKKLEEVTKETDNI